MKTFFTLLFLASLTVFAGSAHAQCASTQTKIKVVLRTDDYPAEIQWKITNASNTTVKQSLANMTANTVYRDSVCVPTSGCHLFNITDAASDGICCAYGLGAVYVYVNNVLVFSDSTYSANSSYFVGCPGGSTCSMGFPVTAGTHTASGPNTWYKFTPPATGMYEVKTCGLGNTCNTKLWMYDYCTNLVADTSNAATIYYAMANCGGNQASINAYLLSTKTYYIRVGGSGTSCASTPINWQISQMAAVSGCLDTAACNFNPFATISNPSSCIYYPSSLCPTGSDLKVDSVDLKTSIIMDTLTSDGLCTIREGCMNGYGKRQLVRFTTTIDNIGATDFYAGPTPNNPNDYDPIFEWDQCHGHWHFEDYAEYLLADQQNNFVPIGYKNGFCVLDLGCTTGSAKFGCGNMGITAGCYDTYHRGLDCQWIDITDVANGSYKLILRANWVPRPDYYGRYETTYTNNWTQACVTLGGPVNARTVTVAPTCAPYVDCNGVTNGLAIKDCSGQCNGTRLEGDLNVNAVRDSVDILNYLSGSIYHTIPATICNDLNRDSTINVLDAAVLFQCVDHGPGSIPAGHSHEPCRFPNRIKNPFQQAKFSVTNINYTAKTIDVQVFNPTAKVLGYQLKLKGITLATTGAQILTNNYAANVATRANGEVIVLTKNESVIPKQFVRTNTLRLKWTSIDSVRVCLANVVAAANEAYEEIVVGVDTPACIIATPTPNSVEQTAGVDAWHLLYPNPVTTSTRLEILRPTRGAYDVTLLDPTGRVVRIYRGVRDAALDIERGGLAAGVYILDVRGEGWSFREKLRMD